MAPLSHCPEHLSDKRFLTQRKFKNLTRALPRATPKAFERWYHGFLWELLPEEREEEKSR